MSWELFCKGPPICGYRLEQPFIVAAGSCLDSFSVIGCWVAADATHAQPIVCAICSLLVGCITTGTTGQCLSVAEV